jgi:hypothetical protein
VAVGDGTTGGPDELNGRARQRRRGSLTSPAQRTSKRKTAAGSSKRYWSAGVTAHSDALDLDRSVFTLSDPKKIARSLKRSADRSTRRKARPFQSAMSMLNFYVNRAGRNLGASQRRILKQAKAELRKLYGRDQ